MSFAQQIMHSRSSQIHLVRCKDLYDRAAFYVVQCPKEKLSMLCKSEQNIDTLDTHVRVIASGLGHEPSDAIWQMLQTTYGLNKKDFDA